MERRSRTVSTVAAKKRWIRPLPERLINKIAAGEVIERPAAVVKELVENSLDADSTRIEISVERSGTKLIKIVDNGCGIAADQIEIAFSRHATSKISDFSDLDRIGSYGFRGEALPSIASVSRTRMVSRPAEADLGTELIYEGGVLKSRQPKAAPVGTTIEVENLFFNTPARRKFLKAETTEARHISRTATALAIGRYDVGFSCSLNGRNIFSLSSGGTLGSRVMERLSGGKELIPVEGSAGPIRVEGLIGRPELAQSGRWSQFLFINGRYITSVTLAHALAAGYGEMLPRGLYPLGAILITLDPEEVDVNVHPAKTEVRLSREREIHDAIYHLVKQSLKSAAVVPVFSPASAESTLPHQTSFPSGVASPPQYQSTRIPGIGERQSYDTSAAIDFFRHAARPTADIPRTVTVDTATGEIVEAHPVGNAGLAEQIPQEIAAPSLDGIRLAGRFGDLYLLFQAGDDLYIVDQHTAHERVLYEEVLRRIDREGIISQQLLFPVQLELSPELMAVFDEAEPVLARSGFLVSHFGGRTIRVEGVPSVLARKSPEKMTMRVLEDVGGLRKAGYDAKKAIAQSVACRAAVMSGDRLSDQEAVALVGSLLNCENKFSCPHGRPTFVRITKDDLNRQFGRG
jgi:DNA mismatch repair protein MutL